MIKKIKFKNMAIAFSVIASIAVLTPVIVNAETTRWSNTSFWGGSLPKDNQIITIKSEDTVILDTKTANLGGLIVKGKLIFEDIPGVSLTSEYIIINGDNSLLQVGTKDKPFVNNTSITLIGLNEQQNIMNVGGKVISAMNGGIIDIHGVSRTKKSWTKISSTTSIGSNSISLADNVNWSIGDKVVIASSSYDPQEAEVLTITSVNGTQVSFAEPLKYIHWGEIQLFGSKVLDERAEVGLLSRNILIQGAEDSLISDFGGHILIFHGGVAHIEGAELFRMGQLGHKARYPIHWHHVSRHMEKVGSRQYANNNSVHNSFHRAYVIHGSDRVLLENNVAYNIPSHAYVWAEDGDEEDNILKNNLGILIKAPKEIAFLGNKFQLSTQNAHRPGVFWGRNGNNTLIGNHAAGTINGMGFFLEASDSNVTSMPTINRGVFLNNTAHSNGTFDEGRIRFERLPLIYEFGSRGNGLFINNIDRDNSYVGIFEVRGFTAYKNGRVGAWIETPSEAIVDSIFADNGGAIDGSGGTVQDITIIGKSANVLGDPSSNLDFPRHGIAWNDGTGSYFSARKINMANLDYGFRAHDEFRFGNSAISSEVVFNNVQTKFQIDENDAAGNYLDADGTITGSNEPKTMSSSGVSSVNDRQYYVMSPEQGADVESLVRFSFKFHNTSMGEMNFTLDGKGIQPEKIEGNSIVLSGLTDGLHLLNIKANNERFNTKGSYVFFNVGAREIPKTPEIPEVVNTPIPPNLDNPVLPAPDETPNFPVPVPTITPTGVATPVPTIDLIPTTTPTSIPTSNPDSSQNRYSELIKRGEGLAEGIKRFLNSPMPTTESQLNNYISETKSLILEIRKLKKESRVVIKSIRKDSSLDKVGKKVVRKKIKAISKSLSKQKRQLRLRKRTIRKSFMEIL